MKEAILKTMSHHEFEELHVFELPTVCRECPDEAAETVKELRKEVYALQEEVGKWRFRFEYTEQLVKAAHTKLLNLPKAPVPTAQPSEAGAEPLPFEPTEEELHAAYNYNLTNQDKETHKRVTTLLKKAVSHVEAYNPRQAPNA